MSETDIEIFIEEAYEYHWVAKIHYEDDGEHRTREYDSDEWGLLAVKIDGKWYALAKDL